MSIITLRNIRLGFGGPVLLDGINLMINRGERICLLGRNGTGKSTLMKIINGELKPDDGMIELKETLRIARLDQEVPGDGNASVYDIVASGLGEIGDLLTRHQHLVQELSEDYSDSVLQDLTKIQEIIEAKDGWKIQSRVETALSKLSLNSTDIFSNLSGGIKRRALLAKALVIEPDLLLLDEPTNHLDIEAITWLEQFLLNYKRTLLFVTHDRQFLQKLATRIIELDRGKLSSWDCDYQTYLERKQAALESEAQQDKLFDKRLAEEERWIRQGIKARRTRNEGRVRELEKMREQRQARRKLIGKAKLQSQKLEASGKIVINAENLNYKIDEKIIIRNFSSTIIRGDKIGIIGPNGCGKTTLLNLLLGKLTPQTGKVEQGTNLEIAYFDQMRAQLNENQSVVDNVSEGSSRVIVNGKEKHIIGYLQDFLFSPERARTPVKALSGGERNRLLLAKLFTKPANLLVLDEPTNDLDIETLELLEALLVDYKGTLLLVSHDRVFLNNVATSTIAFEGNGQFNEYVGGYDDWIQQRKVQESPATKKVEENKKPIKTSKKKLSYNEQRELQNLPKKIQKLEKKQEEIEVLMAEENFYQQDSDEIKKVTQKLEDIIIELEHCYQRWEKLESEK